MKSKYLKIKTVANLLIKNKYIGETIKKKEICLIIGETGCGKTTLIHFLKGINL